MEFPNPYIIVYPIEDLLPGFRSLLKCHHEGFDDSEAAKRCNKSSCEKQNKESIPGSGSAIKWDAVPEHNKKQFYIINYQSFYI